MLSEEQIEKIKNYGRLSYENGYKDGFRSGVLFGCIITVLATVGITLIKKSL